MSWQRLTFYDNLISSGTKLAEVTDSIGFVFYDNLISSGTKIPGQGTDAPVRFTIT